MIIHDDNVLVDVRLNDVFHYGLTLRGIEELLGKYKDHNNEMKAKEMIGIPNCYAYFSEDNENNEFVCKIYKTSLGMDRWIMLMKDEFEGYALYENPESHEYELAWYHGKLDEPLSSAEEEKIRTCYNPYK